MTQTMPGRRHDRLFELIRQGAYAAVVAEQIEASRPPLTGANRLFARRAAASL